MRLYVAGPMTGLPLYNFPAFYEAAARLRAAGHEVINPAEHDVDMGWVEETRDSFGGLLAVTKLETFDWHTALDWDVKQIAQCDGIYFLPGWSRSRGAVREYEAAADLNLPCFGAVMVEFPPVGAKHQPLVGLVGYAQAGKDTFAGFLGYRRLAFADPLKQLAVAAGPRFAEFMHGDDLFVNWSLGAIVTEFGWEYAKAYVPGVRRFLQDLGVGARDVLASDIWVRAAFNSYDPTQPTVITDVRFPNEIEAIRARGGVIVRVEREGHGPANGHVSEFAWQATEPDYVVRAAEGDLDALASKARVLDAKLRAGA